VSDAEHREPPPSGADEEAFDREALDWFVRLQAGDAEPANMRAFRAWCDSDPRRAAAFGKVSDVWGASEFLRAADNVARSTGFTTRKKSGRSTRTKVATAVVSCLALLWCAASVPDLLIWLRADYVTATGELRQIELPDGSSIVLNTDTAVSLDFGAGRRAVTLLKGEAYFDVAHDPARPFVVDGDYSRVTVTGTAFAVRLETEADDIVLSRGKVAVAPIASPGDKTELQPGEAIDIGASAGASLRQVDTQTELAWVDGRIAFDNRPFREVLDQLQRYYPGRVIVVNTAVKDVLVSGNYRLDNPSVAIASLAEAAGATVTSLPGVIVVH
jgi:transmembrane sensor